MALWNDIKRNFSSGNNLMRLIYINVAVFVLFKFIDVFIFLFRPEGVQVLNPIRFFMMPADTEVLSYRPWTPLTYMFLHSDFLHILFNMLWLWWFGKLFLIHLGNRKILPVYLLGGFSGALFFILAYNTFPAYADILKDSVALGASASVIAVVITMSLYKPNMELNLLLIGPVKLKWIGLVTVIIDVLSIPSLNSGGHIAHLGGAAFGALYAMQFRQGRNMLKWLEKFFEWVVNPKPRMRVRKPKHKTSARKMDDKDYNYAKAKHQQEIDRILDKIAKSGYDSLSREEKEKLFNSGQ